MIRRITHGFLMSLLLLISCSCMLLDLHEDTKRRKQTAYILGTVFCDANRGSPVFVFAYAKAKQGIEIATSSRLHECGPFEMALSGGRYHIFAFEDANDNAVFDAGERFGCHGAPDLIDASPGSILEDVDIHLSGQPPVQADITPGTLVPQREWEKKHSTSAGAIADLDDRIFSIEYASSAYWAPSRFFSEAGGNIYFLEPYDEAKTPILFIHGAGGSPRNFLYFFDHINRTRYQPWVYYYPSGGRLRTVAGLLDKKLLDLQKKMNVKRLHIVAHSMGGLVVRSFLTEYGREHPYIKSFLSISTPWGGEALARRGVERLPVSIPSWKDVTPGSPFLKALYDLELPSHVQFYLFFGFKGDVNPTRPSCDGRITVENQLFPPAVSDAVGTYGFYSDHVGILSSEKVLKQYNAILSGLDKEYEEIKQSLAGRMHVRFSFDSTGERLPPTIVLLFTRVSDGSEEVIYLNSTSLLQEITSLIPGTYEVSALARAYRCSPDGVPVTIRSGEVAYAQFRFSPMGMVDGLIDITEGAISQLRIQSITLAGEGVQRTILPARLTQASFFQQWSLYEDFFQAGVFAFFGIPEGEYTLTVQAEGYRIHTDNRKVVPGQVHPRKAVFLVPDHSSGRDIKGD